MQYAGLVWLKQLLADSERYESLGHEVGTKLVKINVSH